MDENKILNDLKYIMNAHVFLEYIEENKEYEKKIVDVLFKNAKKNCWTIKEIIFGTKFGRYKDELKKFVIKYKNYFYKLDYNIILSRSCLRTSVNHAIDVFYALIENLPNSIEKTNVINALWNNYHMMFLVNISDDDELLEKILLKIISEYYNEFISEMAGDFETGAFDDKFIKMLNLIKNYDKNLSDKVVYDITSQLLKIVEDTGFNNYFDVYRPDNIKDYITLINNETKNLNLLARIIELLFEVIKSEQINKILRKLDREVKFEFVKYLLISKRLKTKLSDLEDFVCYVCDLDFNEIDKFIKENNIESPFKCCENIFDVFDI